MMRPASLIFRHAAASGPRGLLAMVAMLALLAAGCDYLDNLAEPVTPDKGDMHLIVIDAWTRQPLNFATCGASDGSWSKRVDTSGRIDTAGLGTGKHTVVCKCTNYLDRTYKVDVQKVSGAPSTIPLARRGDGSWYPEGDGRNVTMKLEEGNGRFPGRMLLQGYPRDNAGIFQYEWTSSLHNGLGGQTHDTLPLFTPMQSGESVELTVTLLVRANLAESSYVAGTHSETFVLKKNQPPSIKLEGNFQDSIKVGCEDKNFSFFLSAKDPDGICESVTLTSGDATSSLGIINETRSCGQGEGFVFPLKAHTAGLTRDNNLLIHVTDDNDQYYDTTLNFSTFANVPKNISLDQVEDPEKNFPGTPLQFHVNINGGNSQLRSLVIDWKDGTDTTISLLRRDTLDRSYPHTFANVGTYDVSARVQDMCGSFSTATLSVPVVPIRLPKKGLTGPLGYRP